MKEDKALMLSKIVKNERLIEDLELRLDDLSSSYASELRTL
jgi:hypothetical protein